MSNDNTNYFNERNNESSELESDQNHQNDANMSSENNFGSINKNLEHVDEHVDKNVDENLDKHVGQIDKLRISSPIIDNTAKNQLCSKEETGKVNNYQRLIDDKELKYLARENDNPTGLRNPRAYCFLNSILQLLFECSDFRAKMIDYFLNKSELENDQFAINLGELLFAMEHNINGILSESLKKVQESFDNSFNGDDIHRCFLKILNTIKIAAKNPNDAESPEQGINEAERIFLEERNKNFGFIFDLFVGQTTYTIKCEACDIVYHKTYQLFKSLPLTVSTIKPELSLQECIKNTLESISVVEKEDFNCCSNTKMMYSEITHAPKYLFIYLVRGAHNLWENKKNNVVTFHKTIKIKTTDGLVIYNLLSVVDHIGGSSYGHYYIKTYSNSKWWLKNDFHVHEISPKEVQTRNAVGFLFEKAPNSRAILQQQNLIYTTIQIFNSCSDFKDKLTNFNKNNKNGNEFLIELEKIFVHMTNDDKESVEQSLTKFQNYIGDHKMNIHEFYLQILDSTNLHTKNSNPKKRKLTESINDENNQSPSDCFFGQVCRQVICESCNEKVEREEVLKSLEAFLPESLATEISIEEYIKSCFSKDPDPKDECHGTCANPSLLVRLKVVHAPKYLFLHLNKVTETTKKETFNRQINIPTASCVVPYRIRDIIFYIGDSETGHYAIRRFSYFDQNKADISREENSKCVVVGYFMEMGTCDYSIKNKINGKSNTKIPNEQTMFSSVVHMLFSCLAFREKLNNFFLNFNSNAGHSDNEWYMKNLGEIMLSLQNTEIREAKRLIKDMEEFYDMPTNIYECFVEILRRTNFQVTENDCLSHGLGNSHGQIDNLDIFNGVISEEFWCENCKKVHIKEASMFNYMRLPKPSSHHSIEECIRNYLEESADQCYHQSKIVSVPEINSFPHFLFIYFEEDPNRQNFLILKNEVILKTKFGNFRYSLISILNELNHSYYTINLYKEWWKNLSFKTDAYLESNLSIGNIIGVMMELQHAFTPIVNSFNCIDHPENDEPVNSQEPVNTISKLDNDFSFENREGNDIEKDGTNCYDVNKNNKNLDDDSLGSKKGVDKNENHFNKTSPLSCDTDDVAPEGFEIIDHEEENRNDMSLKISGNIYKNDDLCDLNFVKALFNSSYFNLSLAPLVKLLYACDPFRISILDYHRKYKTSQSDFPDINAESELFIKDFCHIFDFLDLKQYDEILSYAENLNVLIKKDLNTVNFFECYEWTLNKMCLIKPKSLTQDNIYNDDRGVKIVSNSMSEEVFVDLFFGKIHTEILCQNCKHSHAENKKMKLIPPIQLMNTGKHLHIESYISNYVNQCSQIDPLKPTDYTNKCCSKPRIVNKRNIHLPNYLLIYIDQIPESRKLEITDITKERPIVINKDIEYLLYAKIHFPNISNNRDYRLQLFFKDFFIDSNESENSNTKRLAVLYQLQ